MPQPDHDEPLLPSSSASSEPHEDDGSETGVTRSAVAAALINTLKSVLGTGLLAMPWAFLQLRTHLEMAIILCIILGVWCCYTMVLIHECAVLAWPAARGYTELVVTALGWRGGVLCAVNLVTHQILCVASYLVFVGDNLQDVLGGTAAQYMAAAAPPIILLCWLRDVRALSPASAVGTAALLVALVLVVHEGCTLHGATMPDSTTIAGRMLRMARDRRHTRPPPPLVVDPSTAADAGIPGTSSLAALGAFMGISTFTFCGHSEVVPVVLSFGATHPKHAPYKWVVLVMACIAIPSVLGFSISSMECFGETARKNILLSVHSKVAAALKLLMAAAVLCTCPLKMFPAFEVTEAALGLEVQPKTVIVTDAEESRAEAQEAVSPRAVGAATTAASSARRGAIRNAQRTALVLLAVILALACPDFGFLTAFVGAFCNSLICFVLPPLMYVNLLWNGAPKERGLQGRALANLVAHAVLTAVGTFVLVGGTASVLKNKFAPGA